MAVSAVTEGSIGCCGQARGRTNQAERAWEGFAREVELDRELAGHLAVPQAETRTGEGKEARDTGERLSVLLLL